MYREVSSTNVAKRWTMKEWSILLRMSFSLLMCSTCFSLMTSLFFRALRA